jgi:hypothetical protein
MGLLGRGALGRAARDLAPFMEPGEQLLAFDLADGPKTTREMATQPGRSRRALGNAWVVSTKAVYLGPLGQPPRRVPLELIAELKEEVRGPRTMLRTLVWVPGVSGSLTDVFNGPMRINDALNAGLDALVHTRHHVVWPESAPLGATFLERPFAPCGPLCWLVLPDPGFNPSAEQDAAFRVWMSATIRQFSAS